jgi:hypothetical protein
MPISSEKNPVVLVIHGVQLGDDSSLTQDEIIRKSIKSRLNKLDFAFDVDLYKYENISDTSLKKFKKLANVLLALL